MLACFSQKTVPGASHHHCQGFTLIELIMVIVIIGIAAAFVIPGFVGEKDALTERHVNDTLLDIHTANQIYRSHNNGCNFPTTYNPDANKGGYSKDCDDAAAIADTSAIINMNGQHSVYIVAREGKDYFCAVDGSECYLGSRPSGCQPTIRLAPLKSDGSNDCSAPNSNNPCITNPGAC